MLARLLCAWLMMAALIGCANQQPVAVRLDVTEPDPYVGVFTVFERRANGFIESKRYGGHVRIDKRGEGYVLMERGLEVLFEYNRLGRLVPDPAQDPPSRTAVKELRLVSVGLHQPTEPFVPQPIMHDTQAAVELVQSFQVLYLLRGVGPARWYDALAWRQHASQQPEELWQYQRRVTAAGSRSERVTGVLTLLDKPVDARPGDVLFTPIGKFMYFGKPDPNAYQSGWLNTSTSNKPVFTPDGGLTAYGAERRAWMKRIAYPNSYKPMPKIRLESVARQVLHGMSELQVRTTLQSHLGDRGAIERQTTNPVHDNGVERRVQTLLIWNTYGQGELIISYRKAKRTEHTGWYVNGVEVLAADVEPIKAR